MTHLYVILSCAMSVDGYIDDTNPGTPAPIRRD
jgi:hypothetical protein